MVAMRVAILCLAVPHAFAARPATPLRREALLASDSRVNAEIAVGQQTDAATVPTTTCACMTIAVVLGCCVIMPAALWLSQQQRKEMRYAGNALGCVGHTIPFFAIVYILMYTRLFRKLYNGGFGAVGFWCGGVLVLALLALCCGCLQVIYMLGTLFGWWEDYLNKKEKKEAPVTDPAPVTPVTKAAPVPKPVTPVTYEPPGARDEPRAPVIGDERRPFEVKDEPRYPLVRDEPPYPLVRDEPRIKATVIETIPSPVEVKTIAPSPVVGTGAPVTYAAPMMHAARSETALVEKDQPRIMAKVIETIPSPVVAQAPVRSSIATLPHPQSRSPVVETVAPAPFRSSMTAAPPRPRSRSMVPTTSPLVETVAPAPFRSLAAAPASSMMAPTTIPVVETFAPTDAMDVDTLGKGKGNDGKGDKGKWGGKGDGWNLKGKDDWKGGKDIGKGFGKGFGTEKGGSMPPPVTSLDHGPAPFRSMAAAPTLETPVRTSIAAAPNPFSSLPTAPNAAPGSPQRSLR